MRGFPLLAIALLAGICQATPVDAATLRPLVTLTGPVVRVSDLFDDAGPAGMRVLGPAPEPGGRIIVLAGQLAAIARAYGVAWEADTDGDQVVLQRPGAALPTDAVLAALRPALVAQGAGPDFDIALPFYNPPMLDAGVAPRITIIQLSFDPASGRFSAALSVDTGVADPIPLRLAGNVAASVQVLVPARRLMAGITLTPADLTPQRVRASQVNGAVVQDIAQAAGLQLRRMEFPGQPVPIADLQRPTAVSKGDRLMMALALPGLDLGGVGQAMETGAIGDTISVRNPVSGAVLTAEITGPDQVRVDPGAPPALPANGAFHTFASR